LPTIVLCSTKGGVGKSTTALVLAQVFTEHGSRVHVVDADPNQPIARWAEAATKRGTSKIDVAARVDETSILDVIDEASEKYPFVIVDLEGSANVTASYAVSRADIVLIPMRGKKLDSDEAGKVISLIKREGKARRREIPYRIMFSMVSAIQTREDKFIRAELEDAQIPTLPHGLMEKAAFSAIFQFGCSLFELDKDDVTNTASAIRNAYEVAKDVIQCLKEEGTVVS